MAYKLLSFEQRLEICKLLGEFKTYSEIRSAFKEKFNRELDNKVIYHYTVHSEWKTKIDQFRKDYIAGAMDIAIFHKRHRLQQIDRLFRSLETNDKRFKFSSDEAKFDRLIAALNQARLETEPTKMGDINLYQTQFNSLTDAELKERKAYLIEKILKIQKEMEGTHATHSERRADTSLHEQAIRSEEGKTSSLRQSEQRDYNGNSQGEVKSNEEV